MLNGTLMEAKDGGVADRVVEKLFSDLYHGTYVEDEVSLHNFNVYMQEVFNVDFTLKSFEDTPALIALIAQLFHEQGYMMAVRGMHRIQFKSWEGKIYVQHAKLPIALALACVQNLRIEIKARFTGERH